MDTPTLLVPVRFPDPAAYPLDDANVVGLSGFEIVLVGYWELPEGVEEETARRRNEAEAQAVLYEMAAQFSRAGASTAVRLAFGTDEDAPALQRRVAAATDADAVLLGGNISMWNNVLVPLRDDRHRAELVRFLSGLEADSIFVLELFHVAADPDDRAAGEAMLDGVRDRLVDLGFAADDVETTVAVRDDVGAAIAERAERHNLVVLGETGETADESRFLGPVYHDLAERVSVPVVVLLA